MTYMLLLNSERFKKSRIRGRLATLVCVPLLLAGCVGFNQEGQFFCTEGPTDDPPPCFQHFDKSETHIYSESLPPANSGRARPMMPTH